MIFNSMYIEGYKCFPDGIYSGISNIDSFNIVIGRNNTGKSSLLDILDFILDESKYSGRRNTFKKVLTSVVLTEGMISSVFSSNSSGGGIAGNHYEFGKRYIDKEFHLEIDVDTRYSSSATLSGKYTSYKNEDFEEKYKSHWDQLASKIVKENSHYLVSRLSAERDILPENDSTGNLTLHPNGSGATEIINRFINLSTLDSKIVEVDLLKYLNEIVYPDAHFTDIVVQLVKDDTDSELYKWEVFLEEETKGRVALSKSGSGLKTILLVLIHLYLVPKINNKQSSEMIYIFEELENNLHPALQKRLVNFIYEWSIENKSTLFLTTHSHILINMFSKKSKAKIVHIRSEDGVSEPKTVLDFKDSCNILEDLDVKASDLLQSNGIIWVEGPSDRVYLKKWVSIYGNNKWQEGDHYQILYYGGRVLSHFTSDSTFEETDLINILLTNRNNLIIMDSDKKSHTSRINGTKKRVINQLEKIGSMVWVTKGKEIENYLPSSIIKDYYGKEINTDLERYGDIKDYLELFKKGEGKKFTSNKVNYAREFVELMTEENLDGILDLKIKVCEVIRNIEKWNR